MLEWKNDSLGAWSAVSGMSTHNRRYKWEIYVCSAGNFTTIDSSPVLMKGLVASRHSTLADAKAFCEAREAELRKGAEAANAVTFNTGSKPTTTPGNVMYAKADTYRFNLNQEVRFKPTAEGGGIIYDMICQSKSPYKARYKDLVFLVKDWSPDSDGFVTVPFWEFMQVFGPHMRNGAPAYFEDNAVEVLPMK